MGNPMEKGNGDADGFVTPAVRAGEIAVGLARLTELARNPLTVNALPTFVDVLDTMRGDAAELAAVLAEDESMDALPSRTPAGATLVLYRDLSRMYAHCRHSTASAQSPEAVLAFFRAGLEEAIKTAGMLVLASGALRPADASCAHAAQALPLTWQAIPEAVDHLVRSVVVPLPAEATQHERALAAADANAVLLLREAMKPVNGFMARLVAIADLHRRRGGDAPGIAATHALALAVFDLVRAFPDVMEAGCAAPAAALASMLEDAATGTHAPVFSGATTPVGGRTRKRRDGAIMGRAACMLDARMKAEPETRESVHASNVADLVKAATGWDVNGPKVEDWRARCHKGMAEQPRGFRANHPAMAVWQTYQSDIVRNGERQPRDSAGWARVAAVYQRFLMGAPDGNPGDTERDTTLVSPGPSPD